jgi:transmembrane sensor
MTGWWRWGRRARVRREANRWAIRLRGPDAPELRNAFEAWRATSPLHAKEYDDAAWMIQLSAGAQRTPSPTPLLPARKRRESGALIAVATAIAAAAGGALYLERQAQPRSISPIDVASAMERRVVRLSDGSTASLDPNSRIAVRFDGRVRAISLLSGRAEFAVAHDATHPFLVAALDRRVTARGTRFAVALRDRSVKVVLFEGVVEVSHEDGGAHPPVRLVRGQMLTTAGDQDMVGDALSAAHRPSRGASPTAGGLATARRNGTSGDMVRTYDATPLTTVIADANQGARKPIRLGALGLSGLHVEGRFEIGDTRALARILAAALDLRVEDDGRSWVLTRA